MTACLSVSHVLFLQSCFHIFLLSSYTPSKQIHFDSCQKAGYFYQDSPSPYFCNRPHNFVCLCIFFLSLVCEIFWAKNTSYITFLFQHHVYTIERQKKKQNHSVAVGLCGTELDAAYKSGGNSRLLNRLPGFLLQL